MGCCLCWRRLLLLLLLLLLFGLERLCSGHYCRRWRGGGLGRLFERRGEWGCFVGGDGL